MSGKSRNKSDNNSDKSRRNTNYKRRGSNKRGKETEINIPDSSLNKADLRVLSKECNKNNDVSWYNKIESLYTPATKVPFDLVAGIPYDNQLTPNVKVPNATSWVAPGIMTIRVAPSVGYSNDVNSAVNIAAQQIYVETTKKNNRSKSYDRTDLMMLILGMDSAYMLFEFLDRAYRGFNNISASNRYYPLRLLQAMQIDVDNVQQVLADLRSRINLFAYKLASINVPDQLTYITRHSWLFSHVYKDADTEKAQAYMFMPDGFHVWTEGQSSGPNYLKYYTFEEVFNLTTASPNIGMDNIDHAIHMILDPILGSSDVGLMSSDLAMAFGNDMIRVSPVSDDASLEPVYSEEVLWQISNLIAVGPLTSTSMDITQSVSDLVVGPYLIQTPTLPFNENNLRHLTSQKKYFNLRTNGQPTDDAIMVSSRLIPSITLNTNNSTLSITSSGAEIVTEIRMWYMSYSWSNGLFQNPQLANLTLPQTFDFNFTGENTNVGRGLETRISMWSKFDWAPTLYLYLRTDESGSDTFIGVMQDLDNYTYLDDTQIKMLNDAATMSLFKVSSYTV